MASEGCLIAMPAKRLRLPAHRVSAVDATGAGDTFDGAFLSRLLAGDDLEAAGRYANVAAALSTTGYGRRHADPACQGRAGVPQEGMISRPLVWST